MNDGWVKKKKQIKWKKNETSGMTMLQFFLSITFMHRLKDVDCINDKEQ